MIVVALVVAYPEFGTGWELATLVSVAYATACHGGRNGQTIGKRALRISVRDAASLGHVGYLRAFARVVTIAIFWALLLVPGVLDFLSPLWEPSRQAWHDRVVGTVVIRL